MRTRFAGLELSVDLRKENVARREMAQVWLAENRAQFVGQFFHFVGETVDRSLQSSHDRQPATQNRRMPNTRIGSEKAPCTGQGNQSYSRREGESSQEAQQILKGQSVEFTKGFVHKKFAETPNRLSRVGKAPTGGRSEAF